MTDWTRKRKAAGPKVSEKKKLVPERVKHGSKPKPREYVLLVREKISYSYQNKHRYPTKAAREQARLAFQKAANAKMITTFGWRNNYKVDLEFEELEE